jgi:transcriptional regulator with XRE-family HTH domain
MSTKLLTEVRMTTRLADMTLKEILERHGIHTIRKLCQETGLSRQRGWMLWHGKAGVGKATAKLLHDKLGIPLEELIEVDPVPYTWPRATKAKPKPALHKGRRPSQ